MRVLSLCDVTGNMVRPWVDSGHAATVLDVQHPPGRRLGADGIERIGASVLDFDPGEGWDVVFAFPPCTHFAVSGARWWAAKGPAALAEGLALAFACVRVIAASGAPVWMVENPVGRLSAWWRSPDYSFDPCDFGGYLEPAGDRYTKRTCLWVSDGFRMPLPRRVAPTEGSKMHLVPPGPNRQAVRSSTPAGFARAVFEANRCGPAMLPEVL